MTAGEPFAWAAAALAFLNVQTCLAAAFFVPYYRARDRRRLPAAPPLPSVSILRPLEGADPGLLENLESALLTPWPAPRQLLLCLPSPRDPAFAACEALKARWPAEDIEIVFSEHIAAGHNRKLRHLIAGLERARHEVIVSADSDVRFGPETMAAQVGRLMADPSAAVVWGATSYPFEGGPGARALSCLLGLDLHSLGALAALSRFTGGVPAMAGPCWVMSRHELLELGGLTPLADHVGDDLALAARLHARGRGVVCSPVPLWCHDPDLSAGALVDRLERWIRVLRAYQGHKVVSYPLLMAALPVMAGLGLIGALLGEAWGLAAVAAAAGARLVLAAVLSRTSQLPLGLAQLGWIVYAECLLLVSWLRSTRGEVLVWRGRRFIIHPGGEMEPSP